MNPRHRLRLMLAYLFGLLVILSGANMLANPYGIWPLRLIDKIYYDLDPGRDRLKAPYRVRSEQPTTLLVGSSRISYGMPIEQGCRDDVLNGSLSGASLDEIARVAQIARRGGRLQRVVWGLDFFAFQESFRGFRDAPTRARLDGDTSYLVSDTLLSSTALEESWRLLFTAARGRDRLSRTAVVPVPWPEVFIRDALDTLRSQPSPALNERKFTRDLRAWVDLYTQYQASPGQLDLLGETVKQLEAEGVEVILVVPPIHAYELEAIRQTGRWDAFQAWKRTLAGITAYWDYSGYNELARTDWLFTPVCFCHFHPVTGHVILRQVLGEDCTQCGDSAQIILNAGVRVSASTVQQHLENEDTWLRAAADQTSRYAQLTGRVLSP